MRTPKERHGRPPDEAPTVLILGAAQETGNLGVSALGISAVKGVLAAWPEARVILQSWSGQSTATLRIGDQEVTVRTVCLHRSASFRERFGDRHLRFVWSIIKHLPRFLQQPFSSTNPSLQCLLEADIVLDASSGDSFSDIYGETRFLNHTAIKALAIELGKPLALLPQTIGPFNAHSAARTAREIVTECRLVASRDAPGIEELRRLWNLDTNRPAILCPDMAFILDPEEVIRSREPFIFEHPHTKTLIGLNVSGLQYAEKRDFGETLSYPLLMGRLVEWVLSVPTNRLLLVPHVLRAADGEESDTSACRQIIDKFGPKFGDRMGMIAGPYSAGQTKHLIGQCDFFIGTRMHSCIAAVSQSVPTAILAYSKKASGVFGLIDSSDAVVDLRNNTLDSCMLHVKQIYDRRAEYRCDLETAIPKAQQRVTEFFTNDLRRAL